MLRWGKSEEDRLVSLRREGCSYKEISKILGRSVKSCISKYKRLTDPKYIEREKQYRETNKDKKTEYDKQYYENNKDKIAEYQKQYRENNKDKIAERQKQYYENNKDKIAERQKQYYENNKNQIAEYNKQYYQENKDQIAEYYKKYRENNKDQIAEQRKQYYQDNKDQILEQHKQYYQDNRDQIAEYQKQYYEENKDQIAEQHKQYYQDNKDKILEYHKQYYQDNKDKISKYYQDRINKLIQKYCKFNNIPTEDLEYLRYIPHGDRILETEFEYTNFGTAPTGFERHHIIPYKTCIHYRDLHERYSKEWDYWNNKTCDFKNNSIDLPIEVHRILHSKLTEYGYNTNKIIPLEKFDEYEALVYKLINEINKELYKQTKLDSY